MKNIFIIVVVLVEMLNSYEVSNRFLGLHGISKGMAGFEIESSFDFKGCPIGVDIHKINRIKFSKYCNFKKDKQGNSLVCTEDSTRCIKKSHLKKEIIKNLNRFGVWHVSGVASNDTLSVREGAGSKYRKIYKLPYKARDLKVLSVKNNGRTSWYKIRHRSISGWVSSKYLQYEER